MSDFSSVTIEVTDGIKPAQDYAPNKVYKLTGVLDNPTEERILAGVAILRRAGDTFLRGTDAAPAAEAPKGNARARKAETPASAPTQPEAAPPASDVGTGTEVGGAGSGGGISDLLPETAPAAKEITNEDIIHAVMKKNEALKDATNIRALVEQFNPQPGLRVFKATEIEQKDRAGFLAKLDALTA